VHDDREHEHAEHHAGQHQLEHRADEHPDPGADADAGGVLNVAAVQPFADQRADERAKQQSRYVEEQSNNRADTPFAEYDAERHLLKVNPLADWDIDVIKAYVADNSVPVNPLHARGYPSIGCEPCTRAIKPGEPERAGRWWWEQDEKRECGLHVAEEASAIPAQQ